MGNPLQQQKMAVDSGQWILYRYNPDLAKEGKNPLLLDSKAPKIPVAQYMDSENRFRMLKKSKAEVAKELYQMAQDIANDRYKMYQYLADRKYDGEQK